MPPGLGSRKVLTPKSSKAPRRSLPPQAKLVEAASFESVEDIPSSPDIMTQKLQEKVRERKQTNSSKPATTTTINNSNNNSSSFNQRLAAAATNSLSAHAGRSKLSTEEFKLSDDNEETGNLSEKYKKNEGVVGGMAGTKSNNYSSHSGNSASSGNSYNSQNNSYPRATSYANNTASTATNSAANKPYTSSTSRSYASGFPNTTSYSNPTAPNATSYSHPTASNSTGYNNLNASYSNPNTSYNNPSGPGNSFDRWNSSSASGGSSNNGPMESIEVLKDQLSHQQRDYESLKQRFNELSRIRFSEPEEHLEEHKRLSDLRDQEAQRSIKSLQKEKEQILEQLKALKLEVSELNSSKSSESDNSSKQPTEDSNDEFMNEVENILKIYSSFSGLKITSIPTAPLKQWHCEFSSRSGRFEFQLTYESALTRYQYVPLVSGGSSIKDLPSFLSSDILITSDQMQLFFWRLLDTLSKRKEPQQLL